MATGKRTIEVEKLLVRLHNNINEAVEERFGNDPYWPYTSLAETQTTTTTNAGSALTADGLNNVFSKLMELGAIPNSVVTSLGDKIEW